MLCFPQSKTKHGYIERERERERERGGERNGVNMRNRETLFKKSRGGFIHSSAHLRDTEIEREIVHKAHKSRDGGREN